MGVLLHISKAKYSRAMVVTLVVPVVVLLVGIIMTVYPLDDVSPVIALSTVLAVLLIVYFAILPRRYEVMSDGIVLVLGRRVFLPAASIAGVTRSTSDFHYMSINLTTCVSHCILLQRHNGRGISIRCVSVCILCAFCVSE